MHSDVFIAGIASVAVGVTVILLGLHFYDFHEMLKRRKAQGQRLRLRRSYWGHE